MLLRKLIGLEELSGDVTFGEPKSATGDLMQVGSDRRGVISAVELSAVQDRPAMFSTLRNVTAEGAVRGAATGWQRRKVGAGVFVRRSAPLLIGYAAMAMSALLVGGLSGWCMMRGSSCRRVLLPVSIASVFGVSVWLPTRASRARLDRRRL
jgi:hypothetical protein